MWKKKIITEENLKSNLLNTIHEYIVKFRSIGNHDTANKLVTFYTDLNNDLKQPTTNNSDTKTESKQDVPIM